MDSSRLRVCVFLAGSYVLFMEPASTEKRKYNFKTESYGIIHTFKNYFTTIFLVFSNKRYPNRPINNYYCYATMKMLCDTTRSVCGAVRCGFGSFLAKTITAPYLIFAVTCAVRCGLEFSQNHNCTAPHFCGYMCDTMYKMRFEVSIFFQILGFSYSAQN